MPIRLGEAELHDRVYGCWLGKALGCALASAHAAGERHETLGLPDEIPPSADIAIQAAMLEVVEKSGPCVHRGHLAAAWLRSVRLPTGACGRGLHHLRLGLLPPVTGWHDNPFGQDASAIGRTELWACLNPGSPTTAALAMYEDACIDHAEDGVHASVFVCALESILFVEPDVAKAVAAARTFLPESSELGECLDEVRRAHRRGLALVETLKRVVEGWGEAPRSHAVQNGGYIALSLLYAASFEDAIRNILTCGRATEVTAGTVGAAMGIARRARGVPTELRERLADALPVSPHITVDASLATHSELTRRTLVQTKRWVEARCPSVLVADALSDLEDLDPSDLTDVAAVHETLERSPAEIVFAPGDARVIVDYQGAPTIASGGSKTLFARALTADGEEVEGSLRLEPPAGLTAGPSQPQPACPGAYFLVSARGREVQRSNALTLTLTRPKTEDVTVTFPLVAESCWWMCGPMEGEGPETLRKALGPERELSSAAVYDGRDNTRIRFRKIAFPGATLDVDPFFGGLPGVLYLVTDVVVSEDARARMVAPCTCPLKVWLDGRVVIRDEEGCDPLAPSEGAAAAVRLAPGAHRVMLKIVRGAEPAAVEFHLTDLDGHRMVEPSNATWQPL